MGKIERVVTISFGRDGNKSVKYNINDRLPKNCTSDSNGTEAKFNFTILRTWCTSYMQEKIICLISTLKPLILQLKLDLTQMNCTIITQTKKTTFVDYSKKNKSKMRQMSQIKNYYHKINKKNKQKKK